MTAIVLLRRFVGGLDVALGEVLGGLRSARFGRLSGVGGRRARRGALLLYLLRRVLAAACRPVHRNLRALHLAL
jgi:hypothetical protein